MITEKVPVHNGNGLGLLQSYLFYTIVQKNSE